MHGAVDGDDPAGRQPGKHPCSPLITSLTSSSPTTHKQTRSLAAASSAGDPAVFAAVSAYGSRRGWPAGPQRQLVTAFDDPPRHGAALAAQSDESYAHQPCSAHVRALAGSVAFSRATTHSSTNDSTFMWYAAALTERLRLCPAPVCSLITNRGDAVKVAAISASDSGVGLHTRSCSATLNCTGTRTSPASAGKSCRAQVLIIAASYGAPVDEFVIPFSTSAGYRCAGSQSSSRNPAGRFVGLPF